MEVTIDKKVVFSLIDTLLERWTAKPKKFPYDRPDALIPQRLIPKKIRRNKYLHACFYFYVCIYMRGGIESAQAFRALIRLWEDDPHLFDPFHAQFLQSETVEEILRNYVGWDAKNAGINWVENSRRLVAHWDGNPLNLSKGLRDYDEALRRIRNKLTKREQQEAGPDGLGFRGFQPKMVSMLIYFYDWEGWLEERFLYPAPADFHNFRLGLAHGGIILTPATNEIRTTEKLSAPWRDVVMEYLIERSADPIEVADAIWLFSLVLCGNSPLTTSREQKINGSGMFSQEELSHVEDDDINLRRSSRAQLGATCLRCPILQSCRFTIPSRPYYRQGLLILRPRKKIEEIFNPIDPDIGYGNEYPSQIPLVLEQPDE